MASAFGDCDELKPKFEQWLLEKLKTHNNEVDESLITYISSMVTDDDEDSTDDDKIESIEPILQELNQVVESFRYF